MQVRNYNVANGITKAVTESLETQDILEAKHKTYRKMLREVLDLLELYKRAGAMEGICPDENGLDGDSLEAATTEFVSKNVFACIILADVEISRFVLRPHSALTQRTL